MKKHSLALFGLLSCLALSAETAALVHYDFSRPDFEQSVKVEGGVKRGSNGKSMIFNGKAPVHWLPKQPVITIPGSSEFNFAGGATFYAVVKFDKTEVKGEESTDMLFFKDHSFLFGREGNNIYFNLFGVKQWDAYCLSAGIPLQRWTQLAATVQPVLDGSEVKLYCDGELSFSKKFKNLKLNVNAQPISIGTAWGGGQWRFRGEMAELAIYNRPLSGEDIENYTSQTNS